MLFRSPEKLKERYLNAMATGPEVVWDENDYPEIEMDGWLDKIKEYVQYLESKVTNDVA